MIATIRAIMTGREGARLHVYLSFLVSIAW
jgi:hypothetical protein